VFYDWPLGSESARRKSRANNSSGKFPYGVLMEKLSAARPAKLPIPDSRSRLYFLELAKGFEPLTLWLQIRCSTSWATPAGESWCASANSHTNPFFFNGTIIEVTIGVLDVQGRDAKRRPDGTLVVQKDFRCDTILCGAAPSPAIWIASSPDPSNSLALLPQVNSIEMEHPHSG
jgi:hypothetical protein